MGKFLKGLSKAEDESMRVWRVWWCDDDEKYERKRKDKEHDEDD